MKNLKIAVYVVACIALFLILNSVGYVAFESEHLKYHHLLGKIFLAGIILTTFILLPLYAVYRFKKKDF